MGLRGARRGKDRPVEREGGSGKQGKMRCGGGGCGVPLLLGLSSNPYLAHIMTRGPAHIMPL